MAGYKRKKTIGSLNATALIAVAIFQVCIQLQDELFQNPMCLKF